MSRKHPHPNSNPADSSSSSARSSRFEAYNRLQAAAVAFREKLPIPEIVALGGQSDGKSSHVEALLGFRFNVREVEMDTRRHLNLQMEEDSEEYRSPVVSASAIADILRSRTEAHCPNLTIIDTPGFVLKAKKGEPENTLEEILAMVKSLASPPRVRLFCFALMC